MEIYMTYTYKGICITMLIDKDKRGKSAKNTFILHHQIITDPLYLFEMSRIQGDIDTSSMNTAYKSNKKFMQMVELLNEDKT